METRLMRYFLAIVQAGNITKAANKLHITQPTLSRQMKDLEEEFNTKLFERGKRQVTLTSSGVLFEQYARETLKIIDDAKATLKENHNDLAGTLAVGCVETSLSPLVSRWLLEFRQLHPDLKFSMYDAYGDDIKEHLDKNLIDLGFLLKPVEAAKYHYYTLDTKDRWGVLVDKNGKLKDCSAITQADQLQTLDLIIPTRSIVQDDLMEQLNLNPASLNIIGTHNLSSNLTNLIPNSNLGVIAVEGSYKLHLQAGIKFIPLEPALYSKHVMVWRKNVALTPAAKRFIEFVQAKTMLYPE